MDAKVVKTSPAQEEPDCDPVEETDERVAAHALKRLARRHFAAAHLEHWLALQRKAHSKYQSIYTGDVPDCKVCVAYATALEALAALDEDADA